MIALEPQPPAIEWVDHPWFATPDALTRIAELCPAEHDVWQPTSEEPVQPPVDTRFMPTPSADRGRGSAAVRKLCETPPLNRDAERYLFARMNFEKFRAHADLAQARKLSEARSQNSRHRQRRCHKLFAASDQHLRVANELRAKIVESNMRLVTSIAHRFSSPAHPLEELLSEAMLPLLRAVDLFDFQRGYCFSTYATHTLWNHFSRHLKKDGKRQRLGRVVPAEVLQQTIDESTPPELAEQRARAKQQLASRLLSQLTQREQQILQLRFGLGDDTRARTFADVGVVCGLSKERVRVITNRALNRLRESVHESERLDMFA